MSWRNQQELRAAGVQAHDDAKVSREAWFYGGGRVRIGAGARIDHGCLLMGDIEIGERCLSFHAKKHLAIGRGGMVLCDTAGDAAWLRRMRYDGREGKPYALERIAEIGWHMYMTPEQAARGLQLLELLPGDSPDLLEDYPDLRDMPAFASCA